MNIRIKSILTLSFLLLAMFLGAGNIIFSPIIGQQSGFQLPIVMGGFILTGEALVLLALITISWYDGAIEKMIAKAGKGFVIPYVALLFLALGPMYVIPRTGSVVNVISLSPFLHLGHLEILIFSSAFTALTIWISLNAENLVIIIGKVVAPVFLLLLVTMIAIAVISPMGKIEAPIIGGPITTHAIPNFFYGFKTGFMTMDVLAAFIFAHVFIDSIKQEGFKSENMTKVFIICAIITTIILSLIQIFLSYMGATSISVLGEYDNGASLLLGIANMIMGKLGIVIFAIIVFLTGLTTAVACLVASSDYFYRSFNRVISRHKIVYIFGIFGFIFMNVGMEKLLSIASPLLDILYIPALVFIPLAIIDRFYNIPKIIYKLIVWTSLAGGITMAIFYH